MKKATEKSIRSDLQDKLNKKGVFGKLYEDLVEDYISLWKTKNSLAKDIATRGAMVDYTSNNGTVNRRKNEAVAELVKVSQRMAGLLKEMGIEPTPEAVEDDEL